MRLLAAIAATAAFAIVAAPAGAQDFRPGSQSLGDPLLPQIGIFAATFLTLAFANTFTYALVASQARSLVQSPRTMRAVNRTGGSLLIGAGVATVALRTGQA